MTVMNTVPVAVAEGATGNARPRSGAPRTIDRRGFGALGNSLTQVEAAILDLWDASFGSAAIARKLDLTDKHVRTIVSRYADDGYERAASTNARQGSDQLIRAQLLHGQHDLPGPIAQAMIVAMRIRRPEARS